MKNYKCDQTIKSLLKISKKLNGTAFLNIVDKLNLEFTDELTGEHLDTSDLKKLIMSDNKNNQETAPRIFPQGILFFEPSEAQNKYTDGTLVINPRTLVDWIKENPEVLIENEKYGKQLKIDLKRAKDSQNRFLQVNTFKPQPKAAEAKQDEKKDGLPF